jgi:hypothetical protein
MCVSDRGQLSVATTPAAPRELLKDVRESVRQGENQGLTLPVGGTGHDRRAEAVTIRPQTGAWHRSCSSMCCVAPLIVDVFDCRRPLFGCLACPFETGTLRSPAPARLSRARRLRQRPASAPRRTGHASRTARRRNYTEWDDFSLGAARRSEPGDARSAHRVRRVLACGRPVEALSAAERGLRFVVSSRSRTRVSSAT